MRCSIGGIFLKFSHKLHREVVPRGMFEKTQIRVNIVCTDPPDHASFCSRSKHGVVWQYDVADKINALREFPEEYLLRVKR